MNEWMNDSPEWADIEAEKRPITSQTLHDDDDGASMSKRPHLSKKNDQN